MAAVLAYGPGALLSHRAGAALIGIRPSASASVEVTVPRRSAGRRAGIEVHASPTLRPRDAVECEAIPCTSVARTLLDLSDVLDARGVERAVQQAERLQLFDLRAVAEVLGRADGRRGAVVLRDVLAEWEDPGITERELEERFLALSRAAALPQPAVNAWIALGNGMVKADFLWRAERLVVETDGRATHATHKAFEGDRRRDQQLMRAGYRVVRFTWRQVVREPDAVAGTIGALL
jgi:very-short-patch-repair endonuclease